MAQLVASMSGVVLGGVVMAVGSNLTRGKIFTASIGSVDSLYPSVLKRNQYTNKNVPKQVNYKKKIKTQHKHMD